MASARGENKRVKKIKKKIRVHSCSFVADILCREIYSIFLIASITE